MPSLRPPEAQSGLCLFERLLDPELTGIEFDIAPAERQKLPAPHSCGEADERKSVDLSAAELLQNMAHLIGIRAVACFPAAATRLADATESREP